MPTQLNVSNTTGQLSQTTMHVNSLPLDEQLDRRSSTPELLNPVSPPRSPRFKHLQHSVNHKLAQVRPPFYYCSLTPWPCKSLLIPAELCFAPTQKPPPALSLNVNKPVKNNGNQFKPSVSTP